MRRPVTDAEIEALPAGDYFAALDDLPPGASDAEKRAALERAVYRLRAEGRKLPQRTHRRRAALSSAIHYFPVLVRDLTFNVSGLLSHLEHCAEGKRGKYKEVKEWDPVAEFGAYLGIGRQRASEVVAAVAATGYYSVRPVGRAGVEFTRQPKADELIGLDVRRVNRALYLQLGLTQTVLYQLVYDRSRLHEPGPFDEAPPPPSGFDFSPHRLKKEMPWTSAQGIQNAMTRLKQRGLVEKRRNFEGALRYFVAEKFLPLSADETAHLLELSPQK